MTHVSEGRLQAYLDGELPPGEREVVALHVAGCGACSDELSELRETAAVLRGALGLLDAEPPATNRAWHAMLARPRAGTGATAGSFAPRRQRLFPARWLNAAVLTLVATATLSAALPGSPIYGWPVSVWERLSGRTPAAAPDFHPASPLLAPAGGVSILPSDGRIRILLDGRLASARIRVRLVSGGRASIDVTGDPSGHYFRTGEGWMEFIGSASELSIELPRDVAEASIEVGGRVYLRKLDGNTRLMVPATSSDGGAEVIFEPF
jgi:hypothetical protein